jgi:DNA-binding transcriptional regulator YiaG
VTRGEFADFVWKLRHKMVLSQSEFGRLFDVDHRTIRRWEHGGVPRRRAHWRKIHEIANTVYGEK